MTLQLKSQLSGHQSLLFRGSAQTGKSVKVNCLTAEGNAKHL